MSDAEDRDWDYDSLSPEGKAVQSTRMLDAGATEPYATGTNELVRQKTKHPDFGKLGMKAFSED